MQRLSSSPHLLWGCLAGCLQPTSVWEKERIIVTPRGGNILEVECLLRPLERWAEPPGSLQAITPDQLPLLGMGRPASASVSALAFTQIFKSLCVPSVSVI